MIRMRCCLDLFAVLLVESVAQLFRVEIVEIVAANGVKYWRPTLLEEFPHALERSVALGRVET